MVIMNLKRRVRRSLLSGKKLDELFRYTWLKSGDFGPRRLNKLCWKLAGRRPPAASSAYLRDSFDVPFAVINLGFCTLEAIDKQVPLGPYSIPVRRSHLGSSSLSFAKHNQKVIISTIGGWRGDTIRVCIFML